MNPTSVSVLGLGLMGRAIAGRLARSDFQVTGYNRTPLASPPESIHIASSAADAIAASPISWLMLSDAAACTEILSDPLVQGQLAGRLILNGSTIAPRQSRRLARLVEDGGGCYVETPVLGSTPQAQQGSLQILLGGESADIDKAGPVLEALGTATVFGSVGSGAAVKLAFNQLIGSLTTAFSMSLGLVQREDVDINRFMETLRHSALYAPTFDKKLDRMLARDFGGANFPLKHLLKDIRLFTQTTSQHHIDGHMLIGLQHVLEEGMYAGHADDDYSALFDAVVPDEPRSDG